MLPRLALALFLAACSAPQTQAPTATPPPLATSEQITAAEQEPLSGDALDWNAPVAPFNVIGNIHYVGMEGVSAFLITTPEGHILLDGGFAQSAPQIIASVEALGFDIADVRYLLNSHAHFDHAAGLARLQRASGAEMIAAQRTSRRWKLAAFRSARRNP
ncbi:MAG: MBL fold metallo-hydrolase [Phycisphaerales bacterium]|nr:MBL fold metallo-hydrolase [Hyphomonadaceae bacterium]